MASFDYDGAKSGDAATEPGADDHHVPILVPVLWAAFGTLLALALGGRITNPVDIEAEAAAGAAV